jgi:manganese oxidase
MLELDPLNNFHLHGTMFYSTNSGTFSSATQYTDILDMMQGDRSILQFTYPFPGEFMFHSHHNHFSELGWQGFFNVDNDHSYGYFKGLSP